MKWLIILILYSPLALADVDDFARDHLKWNDTATPGTISDYGVGFMMAGPIAYTAINTKDLGKTGIVTGAYALNLGTNYLVKILIRRERPDKSDRLSHWSGHTSTSFVGAGVVCAQSKKLCPVALGLAGSIGLLRIGADKHWLSDVLVGALVGMTTGKLILSGRF